MVELLHVTPALESVWQFRRRVAWNHGAIGTVRAPGWQTRRCPNGATCRPVRPVPRSRHFTPGGVRLANGSNHGKGVETAHR